MLIAPAIIGIHAGQHEKLPVGHCYSEKIGPVYMGATTKCASCFNLAEFWFIGGVGGWLDEFASDGNPVIALNGIYMERPRLLVGPVRILRLPAASLGTVVLAFDLLPCATEETLLLEIFLKHAHGEAAQFLRQVAFQLPFYDGFYAL